MKIKESLQSYEDFETKKGDNNLFGLYFKSDDCSVCGPFLDKLIKRLRMYNIDLYIVNISKSREISGQLSVFTVPTFILINEGREILRESRFIETDKIIRVLDFSSGL